ncbi:MAG TPA: ribose-phosphate diphosphokinase [Herpetosiphonaceae bacterium]|nr:ribose-phosphate diphosphokinase [Herpetosiphonaceae bacterium]
MSFSNKVETMSRFDDMRIFSGTGNPALTDAICKYVGVSQAEMTVKKFANDNLFVKLEESVREQDVFIVQSLHTPLSDRIMELLLALDACKRDSAGRITAVLPYYAYSRTDKRDQPRVPITARLVADMIEVAGANRVLSLDLHAGQIQGFFRIPFDEMSAMHLLINRVRDLELKNHAVVSTGLGFAKRARNFAEVLDAPLALVENRHSAEDNSRQMNLLGDVDGKVCIIIDDEVATATTMIRVSELLIEHGATRVLAACIHPILPPGAVTRLRSSPIEQLITTDSLPPPADEPWDGHKVVSVAPLLGEVMLRIHKGISVGAMFAEGHRQLGRW